MAKGKGRWKKHLFLLAGLPLLQIGYRMVSPVFEKTGSMKEETLQLENTIAQVKQDSGSHSVKSEMEMAEKEKAVMLAIPDQLFPKDVLSYFVTKFEKQHPLIEFGNLVPAPPTTSNVQADPENPGIKARVMRFQINAKIPSALLVAYLDHIAGFNGLYGIQELTINTSGDDKHGGALQMALGLDFYMTPKEWLPPSLVASDKEERKEERKVASFQDSGVTNWFETSAIDPQAEPESDPEDSKSAPESVDNPVKKQVERPKPPRIPHARFVGSSIVVGEDLFEEGDDIGGWKILEINGARKFIIIKHGPLSRRVRFR